MNGINRLLVVAGIIGIMCLAVANALAQQGDGTGGFGGGRGGFGGGNFDPTQIQQQLQQRLQQSQQQLQQTRMNNYRTRLEVTTDAEWAKIKDRIQKILDAQQAQGPNTNQTTAFNLNDVTGLFSGILGRGTAAGSAGAGGGGNAGPTTGGFARRNASTTGATRRSPGSPEEEALQKALDAKASIADLKAAQAKVIEARKAGKAKLEKAQEELRKVLSSRQEAIAVLLGLL
jgi:hypothetical protein